MIGEEFLPVQNVTRMIHGTVRMVIKNLQLGIYLTVTKHVQKRASFSYSRKARTCWLAAGT